MRDLGNRFGDNKALKAVLGRKRRKDIVLEERRAAAGSVCEIVGKVLITSVATAIVGMVVAKTTEGHISSIASIVAILSASIAALIGAVPLILPIFVVGAGIILCNAALGAISTAIGIVVDGISAVFIDANDMGVINVAPDIFAGLIVVGATVHLSLSNLCNRRDEVKASRTHSI